MSALNTSLPVALATAETTMLVSDLTKQSPAPGADTRRSVVRFRFTQKQKDAGEKERAPRYVDLPAMAWNLDQFSSYLEGKLNELQDAVVRDLVERGYSTISYSDIGPDAMLAFLAAQEAGGRLSKDTIGDWFDSEVAPLALLVLVQKLGWNADTLTGNQSKKVQEVLKGLRDMVTALSGSKTYYEPEKAAKLRVYIELANEDDPMRARLLARLDAMKKEESDLLDIL